VSTRQLDMVIRLAQERRDEAAQRLADGQARVRDAGTQLEQLIGYQRQYIDQSGESASAGLSVQSLMDARKFIAELDSLIQAQRNTVTGREREVAVLMDAWTEATRYLRAVEKLAEVRRTEQNQRQIKREQQQMDDLYAQQFVRNRSLGT